MMRKRRGERSLFFPLLFHPSPLSSRWTDGPIEIEEYSREREKAGGGELRERNCWRNGGGNPRVLVLVKRGFGVLRFSRLILVVWWPTRGRVCGWGLGIGFVGWTGDGWISVGEDEEEGSGGSVRRVLGVLPVVAG